MSGGTDLSRLVPGFDFLQGLMKNAGAALPGMSQWIAPTLDPQEIDKRIQELRTVQFWLEQNARLLGTTIQALEVQRMTLSTLQSMNLPMTELRDALTIKMPARAPTASPAPAPTPPPATEAPPSASAKPAAAKAAAPPAIDPMQWWTALTQQFTEIATKAVKDSTAEVVRQAPAAAKPAAAAQPGPAKPAPAAKSALPAKTAARERPAAARKRTGD